MTNADIVSERPVLQYLEFIKVDQVKMFLVDTAKCIRLTAEFLISHKPLRVRVDAAGNLLSGYEEYLVAHTLGHTTIQVEE